MVNTRAAQPPFSHRPAAGSLQVLTYHVSTTQYKAADLKDGQQIKTLEGQPIEVSIEGKTVTLIPTGGDPATVIKADVPIDGVPGLTVHVINQVRAPARPCPPLPCPAWQFAPQAGARAALSRKLRQGRHHLRSARALFLGAHA